MKILTDVPLNRVMVSLKWNLLLPVLLFVKICGLSILFAASRYIRTQSYKLNPQLIINYYFVCIHTTHY